MGVGLGVYVSVPFCRAKCSYCNFASGVFAAERMDPYVERLAGEIAGVRARAQLAGAELPEIVDTIYFGGGTPSLLSAYQIGRLFKALRQEFAFDDRPEITLECAPGQLGQETLDELLRQGLDRISFGVQSFNDREAQAVGRTHTRALCLEEIARMRSAGVANINVDLIVGLPHQTLASWKQSVEVALASGVPHVSVYMLEVDEDSRLGREMLSSGVRYGAGSAPHEDETAEWYATACEWLEAEDVAQYEISNFAREGWSSRHNIKYWRREPYLGFGLDAHSMLRASEASSVRWLNGDNLDEYIAGSVQGPLALVARNPGVHQVGVAEGFEEALFLGLRMNQGVDLLQLRREFGDALVQGALDGLADSEQAGLVERVDSRVRLTPGGRMVSNEVFAQVLV